MVTALVKELVTPVELCILLQCCSYVLGYCGSARGSRAALGRPGRPDRSVPQPHRGARAGARLQPLHRSTPPSPAGAGPAPPSAAASQPAPCTARLMYVSLTLQVSRSIKYTPNKGMRAHEVLIPDLAYDASVLGPIYWEDTVRLLSGTDCRFWAGRVYLTAVEQRCPRRPLQTWQQLQGC